MAYSTTFYTKEQVLKKLEHFCSYQERCHSEVAAKLRTFRLPKVQAEEVFGQLIENDYLNEQRFAEQFAGGKFRMKQWGRQKIRWALRQKNVSEYCIEKGLAQIPSADYAIVIDQLTQKRWEELAGEDDFSRKGKTKNYLVQKGYEPSLVQQAVDQLGDYS